MTATLVTISFSHYCEKARWALDRAGIAYREEAYVPMTHLFGTVRRGGRSTPLLVTPGAVLKDSRDILRWVETQRPGSLYPGEASARAEVEELERLFDDQLGPHVRRVAYRLLLTSGESFTPVIRETTHGAQRALAPIFGALVPRLVARALRVDEAGAARSRPRVEAVLEKVEARLAEGRRYLVGDAFTAADLTFAALFAPYVSPPEQPVTSKLTPPANMRAHVEAQRARPAGAFALRLYADERAARA